MPQPDERSGGSVDLLQVFEEAAKPIIDTLAHATHNTAVS